MKKRIPWLFPRKVKKGTEAKIAALLILVLLVGAAPVIVAASNTQQKIDEAQQKKEELENRKEETSQSLEQIRQEQRSLRGRLNNLNEQMEEISENLADLENQIREKEQQIDDTLAALAEARATEEWQYESIVIRTRFLYENNNVSYFEALFSASSMAELLNMNDYMEQLMDYDQQLLDDYEANRQLIEEQEIVLQREKVELEGLIVQAEAEKSKVAGLISQTATNIAQYGDQISDTEAAILAYEAEIKKQEDDLVYWQKKLEEERALSRRAANSVWRSIGEVTFEEGDRYLLANLIYCEAGGEPFEGQLAVGAVVINRVLSSVFPDTVVGVIYQSRQFSPVASGRLALALAENRASSSCYNAADQAMSGATNIGNLLFFRTPIEGLSGLNIGGHVFY